MKKTILFSLILLGLLIISPIQAAEERIHNFEIEIKVNKDSSLNVTEKILYDFETLERHGISRLIPYKYQIVSGNFNLRLSNFSVFDELGNKYKFSVTTQGNNKQLQIGEKNKLITGQHVYIINYKVERAINFFADHDELYWNSIGTGWQVPITNALTFVKLPEGISAEQVQADCFYGQVGQKNKCFINEDQNGEIAFGVASLNKNQGLTIVLGWPKGFVSKPSFFKNILFIIQDNGVLFLPVIIFLILFYLWYKKGRDPQGRGTIIPEYDVPENITPAEMGAVIDERVDKHDLSAEIIQLAVKGYLKITRLPKTNAFSKDDYQLDKLKEMDSELNSFQKYLFESLLGKENSIKISNLKNKFYKDLEIIKKKIYTSLVAKNYFPKNPQTIRSFYIGIGVAIFILGQIFGAIFGIYGVGAFIASGILFVIFSFVMPVKTEKGVLIKENILGFKMFLKVTEEDRLKFHNAPEKNPQMFEKFLPYAMVLKVEKDWAKQFEDIYNQSPSWYNDSSINQFSAFYLATALNNFQTNTYATLSSKPGSAASGASGFSGGFSGGGFGGGGGGSW